MARYNTSSVKKPQTVTNHQGGEGYKMTPKFELVSLLVSGFDNTYYEKLTDREKRFAELVKELSKKDLEFLAKAMVYARSVVGQRSVTHFGSVLMAPYLSGTDLGRRFYSKRNRQEKVGGIVYRLDDILEIVACYLTLNPGKPLPNSMKKGFKDAIERADKYELAKYQGKGKSVSLVDIVNLVHPKPKPEMVEVFKSLMTGELKQFNTVEDKNTESGKVVAQKLKSGEITKAEAEVELMEAKEDNFKDLIATKKIGYLALLRNLRNILKNSNDMTLIDGTVNLLTNPEFIKKSLVFPHQIDLALEVILAEFGNTSKSLKIVNALNTAYELSVPNLKELFTHGRTAVVFDSSDSMTGKSVIASTGKEGSDSRLGKATLIAATLGKGIGADVYHFADSCQRVPYNPLDSLNTIKNLFLSKRGTVGYGTAFSSIMTTLNGQYDRVFVISDMQCGDRTYRSEYADKHIYAVHINGYGTTAFKPGKNVYDIYGYGSDIYELIKKVEMDPKALINEIESIVI